MTKTETIIYSVFVVSVPLPFIILLILNIIHPENLSSLLFFRVMTIACLVFELILMILLLGNFLSFLASVISISLLWWGAGWKNFWGLYCLSEHSGWYPFWFYFLLALPWLIRLILWLVRMFVIKYKAVNQDDPEEIPRQRWTSSGK